MLFEAWYFHLFRLIPEAAGLIFLGTAIVREKFNYKQLAMVSLVYGCLAFALFQLPITYGMHLPLGIILFILVMKITLNLNILKSVTASLLSFFILIILEALTVPTFLNMKGYSVEDLTEVGDKQLYLTGIPSLVILLLLAFLAQLWLKYKTRSDTSRFQ